MGIAASKERPCPARPITPDSKAKRARLSNALAAGGANLGLPPETAQRLALAMVEGASALAAQSADSPAILAQRVASPGGTTEAGLKVLDDGAAMARLVEETLRAARDRGEELAEMARNQG